MNSPRYSCVKRDIIWDIGICPVLYSPTDNEGERGKNKTWANIPCIQYILYILKLLGDGCTCTLSLMCEFRVHGGLKFAVYIYGSGEHNVLVQVAQVKVHSGIFWVVLHNSCHKWFYFYRLCCILEMILFIVSEVLLCWCCFYIFLLLI